MTNKEAMQILEEMPIASNVHFGEIAEALNLAIKALRNERPHGKWIDRNGHTWCSECRNDTIYLEGDRPLRTDFCPNCGADMRGDKE